MAGGPVEVAVSTGAVASEVAGRRLLGPLGAAAMEAGRQGRAAYEARFAVKEDAYDGNGSQDRTRTSRSSRSGTLPPPSPAWALSIAAEGHLDRFLSSQHDDASIASFVDRADSEFSHADKASLSEALAMRFAAKALQTVHSQGIDIDSSQGRERARGLISQYVAAEANGAEPATATVAKAVGGGISAPDPDELATGSRPIILTTPMEEGLTGATKTQLIPGTDLGVLTTATRGGRDHSFTDPVPTMPTAVSFPVLAPEDIVSPVMSIFRLNWPGRAQSSTADQPVDPEVVVRLVIPELVRYGMRSYGERQEGVRYNDRPVDVTVVIPRANGDPTRIIVARQQVWTLGPTGTNSQHAKAGHYALCDLGRPGASIVLQNDQGSIVMTPGSDDHNYADMQIRGGRNNLVHEILWK